MVFTRHALFDNVRVEARYLNARVLESVGNALRRAVEGRCGRHGYVRSGSVEVKSVGMGVVAPEAKGSVTFPVDFTADVCNPVIGSVVECTVHAVRQSTLLALDRTPHRVLEVFVPLEPKTFEHETDASAIAVDDVVSLRIVGKRFRLGSKTIVCVGQVTDRAPQDVHNEPPLPRESARGRVESVDAEAADASDGEGGGDASEGEAESEVEDAGDDADARGEDERVDGDDGDDTDVELDDEGEGEGEPNDGYGSDDGDYGSDDGDFADVEDEGGEGGDVGDARESGDERGAESGDDA